MTDKINGSVVVIGGGIAGVQVSTDLAESGYFVYLVEKSPSIGGVMSQLDKTFPTNDCSMCILSPKLVECGRHLNIETMTLSEVESIEGTPGNFKVKVRKKARYIDTEKCTGCGECFEVCPVIVPNEFDQGLKERKAIYRPFPQAYPNVATIDKNPRPCQITCPSGVHAQGYIALIGDKKFKEALELEKKDNPLPAICGRICHHPCESECKRGLLDNPLSIQHLKRFLADWEMNQKDYIMPSVKDSLKEEKIAIIGAGPAGVSCANYLIQEGYKATIFEKLPTMGGMLKVGVPAYRLPKDILDKEIESIINLGVEVKLNTEFGKDITLEELNKAGYKSVFISIGAHKGLPLRISGEESIGVENGVNFLRNINLNKKVNLGEKVVVIGGGNVAIDAARSSLRLGAKKVNIVYRRSKKEMPANPWEIEDAVEEGINIDYLISPIEVVSKNKKVIGLKCLKNKLGDPDSSGRRSPVPIKGSEFIIKCDTIISAIGQKPESSFLEKDIKIDRDLIVVDRETMMTSKKGVFAGGDAVLGPATAIEAIAHGKAAAKSIIKYLSGEEIKSELKENQIINYGDLPWDKPFEERKAIKTLKLKDRINNFNEVESGLTENEAVLEAKRCLNCGVCSECMECVKTCKAEAIDHNMKDEILELNVGAVVMSSGYEESEAYNLYKYGYSKYKNVVTSIEFERILSASGPYEGEIIRPSDRKHPKKVAFLQCIGSRDESNNLGYCSSVCCMYAIKESIIAKEHTGKKLDAAIFYMDIRCYGKDFEKYYERAKAEYGVRFIRSKIYEVVENTKDNTLTIRYCDFDGAVKEEDFDLIVLSVGLKPTEEQIDFARKSNLSIDKYGFITSQDFSPTKTLREGIFTCGALSSPKDIPETVAESSAVSGYVSELLYKARGTLTQKKEYPKELDVLSQEPRIGVFVCHCGINIGGVVKVKDVVEQAKKLPNVIYAEENLYTCSQDTQEKIKDIIQKNNLNRVVVASCSPRTHEPLFQETIREAGLNKYLFEMANIRDQCSWVHMNEPEKATEKAIDLVTMAVYKSRLLRPLSELEIDIVRSALVIGGGVTGMNAALNLANQEYKVYLVEKADELGGISKKIKYTIDEHDVQKYLNDLISKVTNNKNIEVFKNAEIEDVSGYVGNFKTIVKSINNSQTTEINHGVVIVACGAKENKPKEYLFGKNKNVHTQLELENILYSNKSEAGKWSNLIMIQCVGSRNEEKPYCSRVCCVEAIKNAIKIKEINPSCEIYILYRDIRTYGQNEEYYKKARDLGVIFVHYEEENKPLVEAADNRVFVSFYDELSAKNREIEADKLILSTGMEPHEENEKLASLLKVPVNSEKFFLEAHVKLRPVDFSTEGIFLAGTCHSPKNMSESISQAIAASGRSLTILSKENLLTYGAVAKIDENLCSGCKTCIGICSYKAIRYNEEKKISEINGALCKGCGTCVAACPSNSIVGYGFTDEQIIAQIKAVLVKGEN